MLLYFSLSFPHLLCRVLSLCKSVLSEAGTCSQGSCCCSTNFSQTQLHPLLFAIHLHLIWDFSRGSWELIVCGFSCTRRADCSCPSAAPHGGAVRGCRSAGAAGGAICPSRSCTGYRGGSGIQSVCSLLVQCLFWSWQHKTTSFISIHSCVWREGWGETVTSFVYF